MARAGKWLLRVVIVIALVVVGLIAYSVLHDKVTGPPPQTANISDVRSLNTALHTYKSAYGHYPDSLRELAPPVTGPSSEVGAGLIGSRLASGKAHGYRYSYAKTPQGYELHADPDGSENNVYLFSDESAEVRFKRK